MLNTIKLWWYKRQARIAYLNLQDISNAHDCGYTLLFEISSSARREALRFNRSMDAAALLDSNAVKFRYKVGGKT